MLLNKLFIVISIVAFFSMSCQKNGFSDLLTPVSEGPAIIGGQDANKNEFPFLVNIWMITPKDDYVSHHCGGSLVHEKWVLTAAHCLFTNAQDETLRVVKNNELKLFIGSNNISGTKGLELKIKSLRIHPKFSWPHHDLALIELDEAVHQFKPIQLNEVDLNTSSINSPAIVMGWGLDNKDGTHNPQQLQKLSVNLMTRDECQMDPLPQKRSWKISSDILCARSELTKSHCGGDSGGPLIIETDRGAVQIGVVSWGTACMGNFLSGLNSKAAGYAAVYEALPWLKEQIQK